MKKLFLILLFLLIPNLLFASERILSKYEACRMKDGEYTFGETHPNYDLLEVRWNWSEAKVHWFLKQNSTLYYSVTLSSSWIQWVDNIIFQYSCSSKKPEKITYISHEDTNNSSVYVSSIGDRRYYLIWWWVLGWWGVNMWIVDMKSKKYYPVFSYSDFRKLSSKCDWPSGCFKKFSVEKWNVYAYFSETTESEKLQKYRIDFIRKKLFKN